jgi:hypothetical protein
VIVERLPLRSCQRRGAAIDVIVQRSRENRSQLVVLHHRGGPRRGVLAIAAHPQAGASERAYPTPPTPGRSLTTLRCNVSRQPRSIVTELDQAAPAPEPSTAEVRAWARAVGLQVPDRGRLRPDIWQAWHDANDTN